MVICSQNAKEDLKNEGYKVTCEQNEIRKFVESRGSKGNPGQTSNSISIQH